MLGKDARTRVGDYVRLAWRIHNEALGKPEIETREIEVLEWAHMEWSD